MSERAGIWKEPVFNEEGFTQWMWRVLHRENFRMGERVEIGTFTVIDAHDGVVIEDGVKIGFGCTILSYSSIDNKGGTVHLGRNCKIGSHSVIMPGVTIGENAVVGALGFVNSDIPPGEVWLGLPARFRKPVDSEDAGTPA